MERGERERESEGGRFLLCLPTFFTVRISFSHDTRLAKALAQEVPSAFPKRCREAVEDLLEKANEPGKAITPMWVCLNMYYGVLHKLHLNGGNMGK